MLQDLFVEWMLDATLDRPTARPVPHAIRNQSWLEAQRDRALKRFPQADWLIFDGLRDPVGLYHRLVRARPPFVPARPKKEHFKLWTDWAGRWPPHPSVFEMGQVLGAFLACGPELEKAYQGSQGLLSLVDRLAEQSSAEDRRKVVGGLRGLLDWPAGTLKGKVARKLAKLEPLDDLFGQLLEGLGARA